MLDLLILRFGVARRYVGFGVEIGNAGAQFEDLFGRKTAGPAAWLRRFLAREGRSS